MKNDLRILGLDFGYCSWWDLEKIKDMKRRFFVIPSRVKKIKRIFGL